MAETGGANREAYGAISIVEQFDALASLLPLVLGHYSLEDIPRDIPELVMLLFHQKHQTR